MRGFLFGQNHSLHQWRRLQSIDAIPQLRRGLKFHFLRGIQHVRVHGFQHFLAVHFLFIFTAGGGAHAAGSRQLLLNSSANRLMNGFGRDVVCGVVGDLLFSAPRNFINSRLHFLGDFIGVQNGLRVCVARGAAHGLNQTGSAAQKALAIGV